MTTRSSYFYRNYFVSLPSMQAIHIHSKVKIPFSDFSFMLGFAIVKYGSACFHGPPKLNGGTDEIWRDLTRSDRIWQIWHDLTRSYQTISNNIWQYHTISDNRQYHTIPYNIWQDLTRSDKIWQNLTRSDKIWQDKVLQVLTRTNNL